MKYPLSLLSLLLLLLTGCGPQTPPPAPAENTAVPPAVQNPVPAVTSPYAQTLAVLDPGGVQYQLIDGAYEWESVKPILDFFGSMMVMGVQEENPGTLSPKLMEQLKGLPERIGLNEMRVRGSSTLRQADGGYLTKYVIQKQADAEGWIWQLMGDETDMRTRIRQLPENTAFLMHYSLNTPMLYEQVKKELFAFPEAIKGLNQAEGMLAEIGFPLAELLQSSKQGITFALTLNESATWAIPGPGTTFQVPETGLVILLPDEGGVLLSYLLEQMREHLPIAFYENEVAGVKVNSLPIPLPVYPPVSLQMLNQNGITCLATSPDLMKELILRKDGQADHALLARISDVENARASVAMIADDRVAKLTQDAIQQGLSLIEDEEAEKMMGPMLDFYKNLFFQFPDVTLNRSEGDLNITLLKHRHPLNSQYSSSSAMTVPMVGGLLAAIALPSFQKARSEAQNKACINHMRLMESAKDQFAIENNLATGAAVTEEQIGEYIRNGMPVCPAGGTYTIHGIDTSPECSVHGSLNW